MVSRVACTNGLRRHVVDAKVNSMGVPQAHRVRDLPNPNSKVDMLRLRGLVSFDGGVVGEDPLAVIFNDHQHLRTDLRIALSWDDGATWTRVATIEQCVSTIYSREGPSQ